MKIVYIPQRGELIESLEAAKVFYNIKDMLKYIVEAHDNAFSVADLSIAYYCHDQRKGSDDYIVCTRKYFNVDCLEKYKSPQALGFCVFSKSLKSIKQSVKMYFKKNQIKKALDKQAR